MDMKKTTRLPVIVEAFILMFALQAVREFAERFIAPFFPDTRFNAKMISMSMMIVLTIIIICYARIRKQTMSVFPERFSKRHIIATFVVIALFIITPSNYTEGFTSVMTIIYGSIVTPVYEELLFRGYIWNRFSKVMTNEIHISVWNITLFTIWHFLYIVPHFMSGNWDPLILLKIAAGIGYGTVLGYIRLKTGNCWSTILAHGIMNLIMI